MAGSNPEGAISGAILGRSVGRLLALAAVTLAGCQGGALLVATPSPSAAPLPRTLTIGVDMPLPEAQLVVDAIQLAIDDFNTGADAGRWTVQLGIQNDAAPSTGDADPQVGAANVRALIADPAVIGIVGPFNSTVARAEIPITNTAGLLECSPSNTAPNLTKPPAGLEFRPSFPNRIAYVRVATTDDVQGPAAAVFARDVLKKRRAYVVDDTLTFGQGVAAAFAAEFATDGGKVVGTGTVADPLSDAGHVVAAAKAASADVVYFGGTTGTGAADLRRAMGLGGLGGIPLIGPDGIADHGFIDDGGETAANAYSTIAVISDYPGKVDFVSRYEARFGSDPGPYGAPGYACAEVILDALRHATALDAAMLREDIRAYAADSRHVLPTILGDVSFDANGDTMRRTISMYRVDLGAADGTGDWVFVREIDLPKG